MLSEDFNHTIDFWIDALEQYDFRQLLAQSAPGKWSIGQVYMHLISETTHFIGQSKICACSDDHMNEEKSSAARALFLRNNFPDEQLEGPHSNNLTPQPETKEQLLNRLIRLKEEISQAALLISKSSFKGKTKHPGLNYFNAEEWLQFAEMHFRHHLRQKKRIDEFLKMNFAE